MMKESKAHCYYRDQNPLQSPVLNSRIHTFYWQDRFLPWKLSGYMTVNALCSCGLKIPLEWGWGWGAENISQVFCSKENTIFYR